MKKDLDYQVEIKFKALLKRLEDRFGDSLDLEMVLFLIGVQELGKGYQDFSKRQKIELMHVGVCTILEPYGFYKTKGRDNDNWPHFDLVKELPSLTDGQQQHLMKEAMLSYFEDEWNETEVSVRIPENLRFLNRPTKD